MNIEYYCPQWGSEQLPFNELCRKAADAGYDGMEMVMPFGNGDKSARKDILAALKESDLKLIALHGETESTDLKIHADEYEKRLRSLAAANPEFISSQTGRDFFEFEDNLSLLALAARVSEETGVKIIHETHRSKLTYAAHVTRHFLEKIPEMRLTLDVSHWFCVHERFLADQEEAVNLAIQRTDHIHARIGYDQDSQVPDFRMPEWKNALVAHLEIWDRIITRAQEEGQKQFAIMPEFGPAPYMLMQPGTNEPIADQWELNCEMMALLKERWGITA